MPLECGRDGQDVSFLLASDSISTFPLKAPKQLPGCSPDIVDSNCDLLNVGSGFVMCLVFQSETLTRLLLLCIIAALV